MLSLNPHSVGALTIVSRYSPYLLARLRSNSALASVTADFRLRLGGARGRLLWACLGGGLIVGGLLLAGGFWLGRNW